MTMDPDTSGPSANPGQREVGTPGAHYVLVAKTALLRNPMGRHE